MNSEPSSVEQESRSTNQETKSTAMNAIDILRESSVQIRVVDVDDDPTVTVASTPDVGSIPTDEEETVLREAYGEGAKELYRIAHSYTGNELAYQLGAAVNTCVDQTPFNSVPEFAESIVLEGVTEDEITSYAAFAEVYSKDTYPTDVSPFVVATIASMCSSDGTVQTIVNRIRNHSETVEFGTVQAFNAVDSSALETTSMDIDDIVIELQQHSVENITAAVEHVFLFTNQDPPSERTITAAIESSEQQLTGELHLPDETTSQTTDSTATDTEPTSETTNGTGQDPQKAQTAVPDGSNEDEGLPVTDEENPLEEITVALNNAADDSHSALDEAWTIGQILEQGHENYDVSYKDMVESADISYSNPWQLGARNLYRFFEFEEYPETLSVTGVQRVAPGFEHEDTARERLMNASEIDRTLTQPVAATWRELSESFTLQAAVTAVEENEIPYPIETVQLLCRLEGLTPPSEARITALTTNLADTDVDLDAVVATEVDRIQQAQDGCDEAWELGHLIEEFKTTHGYNYTEIRDKGGLTRSAEQMNRAVYRLYAYGEYPSDWSKSAVYHATRLFDDADSTRAALDRCETVTDGVLSTKIVQLATTIDSVVLPDVVTVLKQNDVTDIAHAIKLLCCLHEQEIPDNDTLETAVTTPESLNQCTPAPYVAGESDDSPSTETTERTEDEAEVEAERVDETSDEGESDTTQQRDTEDSVSVTSSEKETDTAPTDRPRTQDTAEISDVLVSDTEVTAALAQTEEVTVTADEKIVAAPSEIKETVTETFSPGLPSKSVIDALKQFAALTVLTTDTGYWAELLTNNAIDTSVTALNPSPKHFALSHGDDIVENGTIRDVKDAVDTPLFIPYPNYDGDIVETATVRYAAEGGTTVLLLGEFPDGSSPASERFMTGLTDEFTYATTIETVQWLQRSDSLHIFTKTGTVPEELQE